MAFWPIAVSGRLEAGRLRINRPRLAALLAGRKDGPVDVVIDRQVASRSLLQNAWYWGAILGLIEESTGQPARDLHEYFKLKFNVRPLILTDRAGVIVAEERIGGSTAELNRITFGEYCENIRAFAADRLDVVIPDPDPNWRQPSDIVG